MIHELSVDIHRHLSSPVTLNCAVTLAVRLIRDRRAPEATEFVALIRTLPGGTAIYPCLDDVHRLTLGMWSDAPSVTAVVRERLTCSPQTFTRAIRLPDRCRPTAPAGLYDLAYAAIRGLGDVCRDDPPVHPLMSSLIRFNRPADLELITYWNEHRAELPGGIAHAVLIYTMREMIEHNTSITRDPNIVRRELRAFLTRTHDARLARFTEMTRADSAVDPPGRFSLVESDGIASTAYLQIGIAQFNGETRDVELGDVLNDLQWLDEEHLFADDRVPRALLPFNAERVLEAPWTPTQAERILRAAQALPSDGSHFSFMRLKLEWIAVSRRNVLNPAAVGPQAQRVREFHDAYIGFQPEGERTVHPGLPEEPVVRALEAIASQGYEASVTCREGCSTITTSFFERELRWLRPAIGQPAPPIPRISTVRPQPMPPPSGR